MFETLSNSWELAKSSWRVLQSDRKLLLFPILSGICFILVTVSFFVPFAFLAEKLFDPNQTPPTQQKIILFAFAFGFYFCTYFVMIFFNAALIACALMRFGGQEATFKDGLSAAASRLPQILAWALVSATVGMILKAIENAHERAGEIIASILGTAWNIMTYFVVPVLVVEKVGPFAAVSRSVSVLKKTWGEAAVGHFGMGLFFLLLFLPTLLLGIGCLLAFGAGQNVIGWTLLGLCLVSLIFWMAQTSALSGIYRAALYSFAAQDRIPSGFDERLVREAFAPKAAA